MREALRFEDSYKVVNGKMRLGHTWFYFEKWDFVIMAPPKCGSTSIKQFVWMNELEDVVQTISRDEVSKLKCKNKYAVIRNPLARFASLWRSKCRDKQYLKDKDIYGLSPRALVAHISSGKKDIHWMPQVEIIGDVDVQLIPLENLSAWWGERGYGELGNFNETGGKMPYNETIHAWLCNFYAEDFILYSKACGFS